MDIGDRVIIKNDYPRIDLRGLHGTIIRITSLTSYLIEFDEFVEDLHNGGGYGKSGHCWDINRKFIKSENDEESKEYQLRIRWYKNGKLE